MFVKCVIVLCVLVACSARSLNRSDTVPELDRSLYLGRWYQVIGNRYGWLSYGDDAVCNTATYGVVNDQTISVLNHNRKDIGTGFERFIRGSATSTEEPGKFVLQLDGVPTTGAYWVLKLGPVVDGQYDFSIVSNTDSTVLFVLTRNVQRFAELYEAEVLEFLEERGFTGYWTRPVPNPHPDDCQYPPIDY